MNTLKLLVSKIGLAVLCLATIGHALAADIEPTPAQQKTLSIFNELGQKVGDAHERLWSKKPLAGAELESFLKDFEKTEAQFHFAQTDIQAQINALSKTESERNILKTENLAMMIQLYFNGLVALSTLKAEIQTIRKVFSPNEYLASFALFIPYSIYWNLEIINRMQRKAHGEPHSTYDVSNYKFADAEGVRLSLNPTFMLFAEMHYLTRRSTDDNRLLLIYKYVAYKNLYSQWSWNSFLLNQKSTFGLAASVEGPASLGQIHTLDLLGELAARNDKYTLNMEAQKVVLENLAASTANLTSLSAQRLETFIIDTWVKEKDPVEIASWHTLLGKRLIVGETELTRAVGEILKLTPMDLADLPPIELKNFMIATTSRAYAGMLLEKASALYTEITSNFDSQDKKEFSNGELIALTKVIADEKNDFAANLSQMLNVLPDDFMTGEKFTNLGAYVEAKQRKAAFELIIKVARNAARATGATVEDRWAGTLTVLKAELLDALAKKKMAVPASMTELFQAFVVVRDISTLKKAYTQAIADIEEGQKDLAAEKANLQNKRTLSPKNLDALAKGYAQERKAWDMFAYIFSLREPGYTKLFESNVLKNSPEELLRSTDADLSDTRLGLQKNEVSLKMLEMFPLLRHNVAYQGSDKPLFLVITKEIAAGKGYRDIMALIVSALQTSQASITKNLAIIEKAQNKVALDDLLQSPDLAAAVKESFSEFSIIQRHWVDEISVGTFYERNYQATAGATTSMVITPLMLMIASEFFMRPGAGTPAQPHIKMSQKWTSAIGPMLWTAVVANFLYADGERLYRYGLGYQIDFDWANSKVSFVKSGKNQQLEDFMNSSSVGAALVSADYYDALKAQYTQTQVQNHISLVWDSVLLAPLLKLRTPGKPGLNPPSKLQIDAQNGDIKGIQ